MEKNFGSDDVYAFLKTLVELGGVYFIDNQHCLSHTEDRTPVGVTVGADPKKKRMIALFKEGERPPENSVYLNPFVELIGDHPELDKFNTIIGILPGCLTLKTMMDITELILSDKKDTGFKTSSIISPFVGKVDQKFLAELQKIRPVDAGCIAYDSKKYIAQLQCMLVTDEWVEKNKSKFRKSSIKTIREMAETIYGTPTPHKTVYTGTLPPCKRFDAVIHVLVEYLSMVQKVVEPITGIELHVDELKEHVERLPAYHKAMQWLATTTSAPQKTSALDKTVASKHAVPWSSTSGALSNAAPIAPPSTTVINPTFGGSGVVSNPNFGGTRFGSAIAAPVVPIAPVSSLDNAAPVIPSITQSDFAAGSPVFGGGFGRPIGGFFI